MSHLVLVFNEPRIYIFSPTFGGNPVLNGIKIFSMLFKEKDILIMINIITFYWYSLRDTEQTCHSDYKVIGSSISCDRMKSLFISLCFPFINHGKKTQMLDKNNIQLQIFEDFLDLFLPCCEQWIFFCLSIK